MPSINLSAVSDAIQERFPYIYENLTKQEDSFLSLVPEEPVTDGRGPRWKPITEAHNSGGTHDEGGDLPAADKFDNLTATVDTWARYARTVEITEDALLAHMLSGDLAVAGYLDTQMMHAAMVMKADLNSDLLSNDRTTGDSNGVDGLPAWLSDSNTYAGIDRTTTTIWQAIEDTTSSAVTKAILDNLHDTIVHTRGGNYDAIVGPIAQIRAICDLDGVVANRQLVTTPGQQGILGFAGQQKLRPMCYYNERPCIAIPDHTAGSLYFVSFGGMFGCRIQYLLKPTPMQFKPVEGKDLYAAAVKMKCATKYTNPRKGGGYTVSLS